MGADFWLVLHWWGVLFLIGAVAFPLTRRLFDRWHDHGYLFAKAVGMATVTWVIYALGTLKILPFTKLSIIFSMAVALGTGIILNKGDWGNKGNKGDRGKTFRIILLEEIFFFLALLFWSWIKGHEPSIRGLEKFMDFGFMKSILESTYFPPADMWYAGAPINYYYFGHLVTAVLTKLSGLDLAYTFNLMLATLFALTLTMSFSIGVQLSVISGQLSDRLKAESRKLKAIAAGLLTAFLVALAGNMQTIYAFTQGYTGENVQPFWQLLWNIREIGGLGEIWGKIGEGMRYYWYANATRFIPFSIHEFPSYSFVVSDVHGHVLSIPFVLLAIGLLVHLFGLGNKGNKGNWGKMIFYGFLVGILLMTNALDGPIYFGLFMVLFVWTHWSNLSNWTNWGKVAVIIGVAGFTSIPFFSHFKSFVNGIAVNCPPAFLADTKIGPILFEGVEKCQRSPFWMWWLLWGFFIYCGLWLIATQVQDCTRLRRAHVNWTNWSNLNTKFTQIELLLVVFFLFSMALIIFPEFFYFKDIYPAHFRSNTMFKLGYQAFILFSIVAGYTIIQAIRNKSEVISRTKNFSLLAYRLSRTVFFVFLIPQLFLISIYPIFSVRSYFNSLSNYEGLYGLGWLRREYPDDWAAIQWLNQEISDKQKAISKNKNLSLIASRLSLPVVIEADGDSYTDYARFSAFTGIPTIIGWPVHEWLWRGSYDVVAPRREDVRQIYETGDLRLTRELLDQYSVGYVIVGTLERQKYPQLQEEKFVRVGEEVYRIGDTVIYRVKISY